MVVEVQTTSENNDNIVRKYFCKTCSDKAEGYSVPEGWFIVRKTFKAEVGQKTVGVYCSSRCLTVDVISAEFRMPQPAVRLMLVSNSFTPNR